VSFTIEKAILLEQLARDYDRRAAIWRRPQPGAKRINEHARGYADACELIAIELRARAAGLRGAHETEENNKEY